MTVSILIGDCRDVLAALPEASVQCVVTSPPYYGLRSYGIGTENGEIGLEQTPDAYVAEMVAVFREVRRVLRNDGVCWINLGDSFASTSGSGQCAKGSHTRGKDTWLGATRGIKAGAGVKPKDLIGIPWRVAFALQADGWYLRSEIIWHKKNPMPESVSDRPTKAHEQVFLLSKSPRYFYDAKAIAEPSETYGRQNTNGPSDKVLAARSDGLGYAKTDPYSYETRNRRSVWTIATQPYSGAHFATMPPELAETCIKAGSSEKGQCPHCGAPWGRVGHHLPSTPESEKGAVWAPLCACPAHQPVPQMILDPFGGAGTTALVADRLRRDATIIELNPAYAALARERINGEAGLFSPVAAE